MQVSVGKFVLDTAEAGLACMCVRSNHLYRKLMEQHIRQHNGFNLLFFVFCSEHDIRYKQAGLILCVLSMKQGLFGW